MNKFGRDDCLCWRTDWEREMMTDDMNCCKHCGRLVRWG